MTFLTEGVKRKRRQNIQTKAIGGLFGPLLIFAFLGAEVPVANDFNVVVFYIRMSLKESLRHFLTNC